MFLHSPNARNRKGWAQSWNALWVSHMGGMTHGTWAITCCPKGHVGKKLELQVQSWLQPRPLELACEYCHAVPSPDPTQAINSSISYHPFGVAFSKTIYLFINHLQGREIETKKESGEDSSSFHWLPPGMLRTARAGKHQGCNPETPPEWPTCVVGPKS